MKNTSSNRSELTPSLFDEPATVVTADDDDELDDWYEVAQPLFLSWSLPMQLHYCWRRDLDAALRVDCTADAAFFLARAASYKHDLDALKGTP